MYTLSVCSLIGRLGCVAALSLLATVGQAQTRPPGLKVVPQPAAPTPSVTPAAQPSTATATSPGLPNPAGLTSRFPAEIGRAHV